MKFTLNKPVETKKPEVAVDPGLPPGNYRFRLVVEDDRGQRSPPAELVVTVLQPREPEP